MLRARGLAGFTRFFVNKKFVLSVDKNDQQVVPRSVPGKSYMLYVHIPFCESLCPYCSFFRVPMQHDLSRQYFVSLRTEIARYVADGFVFNTLYFGGGTPTILPDQLVDMIAYIKTLSPIGDISVETHPRDLTPDIMRKLKTAGVNRLSVGIQTFDDQILERSNRLLKYGSGEEIKALLIQARGIFDTLNADLIFNFPGQTEAMLRHDLEVLRLTSVDQVTYYPLMTSDATAGTLTALYGKLDYGQEERFYRIIQAELGRDFFQASAWCFSKQSSLIDEYVVNNPEYLGVGAGALSLIGNTVFANTFSLQDYSGLLASGQRSVTGAQPFSRLDRYQYELLFKLFGRTFMLKDLEATFPAYIKYFGRLELLGLYLLGLVRYRQGCVELTESGLYCLLAMMREMISGLNNFRAEAIENLRVNGLP